MPFSPQLGLLEITPGDPAYRNSWGTGLNDGVFGLVDDYTAGQLSKSVAGSSNVVLTYTDGVTCESRQSHFIFTGVLTGNIYVFWPASHEFNFSVSNQTTGAFTLTLAVGTTVPLGSSMVIANGGTIQNFRSDGTNVLSRGGALSNTGVVAGSYTNASLTVGVDGRLTAASNGEVSPIILASGSVSTGTPNFLSIDLSTYSAYKRLEIQVEGVTVASGADSIQIKFSTNGGSTFIASGYNAISVLMGAAYSGSAYTSTASIPTNVFTNTGGPSSLSVALTGVNQSYIASALFSGTYSTGSNFIEGRGVLPGVTNVNGILLYNGSINITGGTYRVIGYV